MLQHIGGTMAIRFATIAVILAIVGSDAFADAKPGGNARQIAMGGSNITQPGVILNPFMMNDPALLLINPAYQAMYKDYAWMNLAGGLLAGPSTISNAYVHQNAGVNFALNREWTVGAILSYDPSAVNGLGTLLAGTTAGGFTLPSIMRRTPQGIPAVANVWEVLASWHGSDVDVGFGVMYGDSKADLKTSTTTPTAASSESEASASMIGFRGGVNFDLGSGSSVEASGAVRLSSATDNITVTPAPAGPTDGEYSADATEINFMARAKFKASNKWNIVPYALVAFASAEPKEDRAPTALTAANPITSVDASAIAFAVGIGGEYRVSDLYLVGGLSFQYAKADVEWTQAAPLTPVGAIKNTATTTGIPVFNIGGEWWLTGWLAGRAGYFRNLARVKLETESTAGTTEATFTAPFSIIGIGELGAVTDQELLTLGLGFVFGNFSLDATVSEEALRRGLGLIGSAGGPGAELNTFGYMNASYNFE